MIMLERRAEAAESQLAAALAALRGISAELPEVFPNSPHWDRLGDAAKEVRRILAEHEPKRESQPQPQTHDLIYRFFELYLSQKRAVITAVLGEMPEMPPETKDLDRWHACLVAIAEQKKLGQLADEIAKIEAKREKTRHEKLREVYGPEAFDAAEWTGGRGQ